MNNYVFAGDWIRHHEYGIGLVKRLRVGRMADVIFDIQERFVEVKNLDKLSVVEQEKLNVELLQKREKASVESLLSKGNFDKAEIQYLSKCASWWNRDDFDERVINMKFIIEEDRLKSEHLDKFRKFQVEKLELEKIERLRLEQLELERIKEQKNKQDQMRSKLNELRFNSYLYVDTFYNEFCKDFILVNEYERDNVTFVKDWLSKHIPPDKSGKIQSPDDEQVSAIGEVNHHTQVVARAGSGKTTTIVNRAHFLQKHCGVAPSEMLLLAFNNNAAAEIAERLDKRLNGNTPFTMTFHALAYALVHPEESILYDNPSGNNLALSRAFQIIINDHLNQPEFEILIREIMLAHFRQDWERILKGGLNLSKEEMILFRRSRLNESLSGHAVKSFGEKVIADFLFEHDVTYKYERNHDWNNINYRPDFTLFATDKSGVIIEYFGMSGDADYDEMSEQKREYWRKKQNWQLLEYIPSDITSAGVACFREQLKVDLELCGIPCKQLSEDEIWDKLKKRGVIDRFTGAIRGFILKCRKNWLLPNELSTLIQGFGVLDETERLFNNLALHFYNVYMERIDATGEDDFDGLMQKATINIEAGITRFDRKAGSGDLKNLRYVFIDEFQDFSEHFWRLVDAMRKQNPNIKFFCVGDDWQAINGFAGSDLKFFSNFENHFENSLQKYISTNYRSSQLIVNIGNSLMAGLGKPARSHKESAGEVITADLSTFMPTLTERKRHSTDKITPAVARLVSDALNMGSSIVMLSRNNYLPYYLSDVTMETPPDKKLGLDDFLLSVRSYFPEALHDRISISTAHKYKGKEKLTVIILDAIARCYPLIHPDWIFARILGDDPRKIIEEERRLFYVALTRAVDKLIIITEKDTTSAFFDDIQSRSKPPCIHWDNFPPPAAVGEYGVVVVKVTSQATRGSSPTYNRRDLLKACGYDWESTGKGWAKGFSTQAFDLELVKHEVWATDADGIEVCLYDEQQIELKKYFVDGGVWREVGLT
ncbi:MAG: UvrD-helicase domain-containing protein [Desulfuromonadales bacterium]|nr:UvrD-helicase domain-containing protein [Desulfuromonadales bacterium]